MNNVEREIKETAVHGHPFNKTLSYDKSIYEDCHTVVENAKAAVNKFQSKVFLRYREVERIDKEVVKEDDREKEFTIPVFGDVKELSFLQFWSDVVSFGDGLIKLTGVKEHQRVCILMETRREWITTAHSCWRHGIVLCSCYTTLGVSGIKDIINETEVNAIICEKNIIKMLEEIKDDIPNLKYIIYTEDFYPNNDEAKSDHFQIIKYDDVKKLGKENIITSPYKPTREDICSIMYTSGTTGRPKGVLMKNKNYVNMLYAVQLHAGFNENEVFIGYLPMAHIMGNAFETGAFLCGTTLCLGTPRTLTDTGAKPAGDLTVYKPTVMMGVPRVFETIRKKILAKINKSKLSKTLFNIAFDYKNKYMMKKEKTPLTDILMFKKIKKLFGGRMRFILSGGAPLSKSTHRFIQTILYPETYFTQAFGSTETHGSGLCVGCELRSLWEDISYKDELHNVYRSKDDCGYPMITTEVKLRSVPEMSYSTEDEIPKGELLIRGSVVSDGYFKMPEKTKETFVNGWYRTGDIAQLNPDKSFTIIDRIKNFMKLQNGEFISPERLEADYGESFFVSPNGLIIIANPFSNNIIAIVVPNKDGVIQWAADNGIKGSLEEIKRGGALKKAVLDDFNRIAKAAKLAKTEVIKDIIISDTEWTIQNGLVNSTQKLQRNAIKQYYKEQIDEVYSKFSDN